MAAAAAVDVVLRTGDGSCCLYDDVSVGASATADQASEGRAFERDREEKEEEGAAEDDNDDNCLAAAAAADTAAAADDASKEGTGGAGCCARDVRSWALALLPTATDCDDRWGEEAGLRWWEEGGLR